ncbi:MAG: hypothetical protein ABI813_00050 [Bacteroidota bacterium]
MLIEKKENKNPTLSVVRKPDAILVKASPVVRLPSRKREGGSLFPPIDEFNSGYLKGRENDPL